MSFYRNVYLRSDDWKNLRAAKIHKEGALCKVCKRKSTSNDVHHLDYKNLYDVTLADLVVVCRPCHDKIHELLDKYPRMKRMKRLVGRKKAWAQILLHLSKEDRVRIADRKIGRRRRARLLWCYNNQRRKLLSMGLIRKHRLPMREEFLLEPTYPEALSCPYKLIDWYVEHLGLDPRKWVLDIVRPEIVLLNTLRIVSGYCGRASLQKAEAGFAAMREACK